MKLTLKIWRQADAASDGAMHTYQVDDVSPDTLHAKGLAHKGALIKVLDSCPIWQLVG